MPNEAQMAWYTQRLEDEKLALSRLEDLLDKRKLAELQDYDDDIADTVYRLLTRIAKEKRIEYVFLAEVVRDFYSLRLNEPYVPNPHEIAEHATIRSRVETMQNMYPTSQPCV